MIETLQEAISFIEAQRINNTTLKDFKKLFEKYDNFQHSMHFIHITGTNGKGSTSKMLSDALIKHEYDVGLFTSPHMIVANDRIRINNEFISDEALIYYTNKYYEDILTFKLSFFQIYTLIALSYFYDKQCHVAIVEVGIGGLLDSTNVIDGIVSIITNINYDHTDKLGQTISEIAYQKAGIIKKQSHVITGVSQNEAKMIIQDVADDQEATVHYVSEVSSVRNAYVRNFEYDHSTYSINSLAKYQVHNALLALKALSILKNSYRYKIDDDIVKAALKEFVWAGRFELVCLHPQIILDGAHNIAGLQALIDSDEEESVVIFSALKDKEYEKMISMLTNRYEEVVFCEFDFYRSLKKSDVKQYGLEMFSHIKDALRYVVEKYPNQRIIICGSLYFISDVRSYIKGEYYDSNK